MPKRMQSVVSLSFDEELGLEPQVQKEREIGGEASVAPSEAGKDVMALCREIAVAMIGRYQEGEEASKVREEIAGGLVEVLDCSPEQAASLIDLSLELVQVTCYGDYKRNPVELAILVRKASGVWGDVSLC